MAKRKAIYVDGFSHKNPIPPASRLGNFIATGIVSGRDTDRKVSPDPLVQARAMFVNLEKILTAAGASFDDILKLNVWISEESVRAHLNIAWLEVFPDAETRPARQVMIYAHLTEGQVLTCDALVVTADL
ncbi:MAG: RidA family protein [Micropepsaceae bacterium]